MSIQDFEIVAMVRSRLVRVTLLDRTRDSFADWPAGCAVRILPAQSILFARRADDLPGVFMKIRIIMDCGDIFILRLYISMRDLDRVEFVFTDAPEKNLLTTRLGIEVPLSLLQDDRNGKRPIIFAN